MEATLTYLLYYFHMSLSPEQLTQVEKILADYRKELDAILLKHTANITAAIENIDKEKSETLKKRIAGI